MCIQGSEREPRHVTAQLGQFQKTGKTPYDREKNAEIIIEQDIPMDFHEFLILLSDLFFKRIEKSLTFLYGAFGKPSRCSMALYCPGH